MPFLPVGGQAVIEGVMMRSPSRVAVAVRRADGSIATLEKPYASITARSRLLRLPVVRGAVSLFETLSLGVSALNYSADEAVKSAEPAPASAAPGDESTAGPPAEPRGNPAMGVLQVLSMVVAFALGILLFIVLPAKITGWLHVQDRVQFGLVDGAFRLLAFVLYLLLISQWKEMRRVLGYHGAEHKTIHALENRAPLTAQSVQSFSRFHPRCGTSFLFLVVVVSIVVFTAIGRPHRITDHVLRVAAMPLIAGVAFEFIRISGRYYDRPLVRALVWPGLQFQRLTTREPDLSMCEVAIAAMQKVRSDPAVVALEAAGDRTRAEVAFVQ